MLPCYHRHCKKIKINDNLREIYNSEEVKKLKRWTEDMNSAKIALSSAI